MTEANIIIEDTALTNSSKILKTVRISGQLDESNVDEKIQVIYKIFETNAKGVNMLFDLENLDYMNSKSIGYLTDLYGKITEGGGTAVICKAKPNITDILQVVGLTQLIKTFDGTEEAKKYIVENGTAPVATPVASTAPVTPATAATIPVSVETTTSAATIPTPEPVAAPAPATAPTSSPIAIPAPVTAPVPAQTPAPAPTATPPAPTVTQQSTP